MRSLQEAIGRHYKSTPQRPAADTELRRGVAVHMAIASSAGRPLKQKEEQQ
ncbi:hypothetical protein [Streptomyces sp. NRRL S-146]|uniref:hypothetical protein n=1 Tax=Streptomyces sp. NRRL S-146 TaxID=1463884 RepID=UPI000A57FF65|nr:hypothetical protein [Streptomyces sp. NRRL S-146]